MNLLICTQVIDQDDQYLGFFHTWVAGLAGRFERVEVICLKEGRHTLPPNVQVHSLGKERGSVSRLVYAWRFIKLAWRLRREYDAVLVHMNQEYVLLAGWLWKFLDKRLYMWRNHYQGTILTDIAAGFCTKVFCTSKFSYTAKYRTTVLMPVGVDTALYHPAPVARMPRSILFYARLAPSKHPELLLEALGLLYKQGIEFSADFYGTPLPKDEAFLAALTARAKELGFASRVNFYSGRPPAEGPAIFSAHEVFVNAGASGMYDKTLFEAAACGCVVLAASADWAALVGSEFTFVPEAEALAQALERTLNLTSEQRQDRQARLGRAVEAHSLPMLARQLVQEMAQ